MSVILITGSSSGLGRALYEVLRDYGHEVIRYDIKNGDDVLMPSQWLFELERVDILINCAAVNIINWLPDFSEADWDRVMDVNAKGIFKMTQAMLPHLIESKGAVINICSNAAHMPMTCSLAYNASKAASEIMTKQLARELTKKHGITVFGVAPAKLCNTEMSRSIDAQVVETRGWTTEEAQRYQLAGLLCGEEIPPMAVADFISDIIRSGNMRFLTGTVLPFGL